MKDRRDGTDGQMTNDDGGTDDETDGWTEDDDGDGGTRRDERTVGDDDGMNDGTDGRIEDDDCEDGTDAMGRTDDTNSFKVSHTTWGAKMLLSLCVDHGTPFLDAHSKIPPDSSIYGQKIID